MRDEAAAARPSRRRSGPRPAPVEPVGAAIADRLERRGQIGLPQHACRGPAARRRAGSSRARRGTAPSRALSPRDGLCCGTRRPRSRRAPAGWPARSPSRAAACRTGACASVRPATAPGTPAARWPVRLRSVGSPVRVEVHVARGARPAPSRGSRASATVPSLESDHHEAAAAEVARLGMHHRQGEAHRHRRVHRVAALAQDVAPHRARDARCPPPPSRASPR